MPINWNEVDRLKKESKAYNYDINNFFYISVDTHSILITDPYECLQSEYADQIIKYLCLNKNDKLQPHNAYIVYDTEKNRKKLDKVVALIEKYVSDKQKEAEAFIDNYINNRDIK